jgi:hypothetical protein
MRSRIVCPFCKKSNSYDKSDCINIGTIVVSILAVKCKKCDSLINLDRQKLKFPPNKDIVLERDKETDGILIRQKDTTWKKKPSAIERANSGDIREFWVQEFFREHYKDYGFKRIDGPYDVGPDFFTSGGIGIEIERFCESYIAHKHHLNSNFSKVKYLVVLCPGEPKPSIRKLLPEKIIYIDIETFVPWYRIASRKYALNKEREREQMQLTLRFELIRGEFYRRWLHVCPRVDGDMAACPACQGCAYEPEFDFYDWAIEFSMLFDHSIWSDDFSFSEIEPENLDKFFINKLTLET